jgi:hypothetical protein
VLPECVAGDCVIAGLATVRLPELVASWLPMALGLPLAGGTVWPDTAPFRSPFIPLLPVVTPLLLFGTPEAALPFWSVRFALFPLYTDWLFCPGAVAPVTFVPVVFAPVAGLVGL